MQLIPNPTGSPTNPNECPECGHDLVAADGKKVHVQRGSSLICSVCLNICKEERSKAAPAATGPVQSNPVQSSTGDVERVAQVLADKMKAIQNQQLWHDLQSPGAIIQAVDGGYIIMSRFGATAVRCDLDEALAKTKEYPVPP